MSVFFLKVLNISITAGWLVAAVVMLRFVLKKAPKWVRCLLWGIVALRLLLPLKIESNLSLLPSAEPVQTESIHAELDAEMRSMPVSYERVVLHSGFQRFDDAVNPIMEQTAEDLAKTGKDAVASFKTAAAWVWIAGVGVMQLYAVFSFLYMKHKVRVSIETERNVFVCDEVHSPFILGVIRPQIYLPSGLDAQTREHVLAHEYAHIRRLDHLWKPLGFLLLSIHWFNPLIWAAFILLSRDIELACDEKVVSQLDAEGKASYSDTLLAFSQPRRAIAVCPVAFGEVSVKKRVKSVLSYQRCALWIVLIALVCGAAVAVCFLTAPKPAKTAEMIAATSTETKPRLPLPEKLTGKRTNASEEPETADKPVYLNLLMCADQQCDKVE